jgi:hypothetical protein
LSQPYLKRDKFIAPEKPLASTRNISVSKLIKTHKAQTSKLYNSKHLTRMLKQKNDSLPPIYMRDTIDWQPSIPSTVREEGEEEAP